MWDVFRGWNPLFLASSGLIGYLLMTVGLYRVALKLKHPSAGLAFLPIINLGLMLELGGLSWGWMFLLLLPIIRWFFVLIAIGAWCVIARRCQKSEWLGILMAIPLVNVAVLYILGSEESRSFR